MDSLNKSAEEGNDVKAFTVADVEFHMTIVHATGNAAIVQMLKLYELPCDDPISADQIMAGIMNDKKKRGSNITAVVVNKIGKGELKPMPVEEFRNYL